MRTGDLKVVGASMIGVFVTADTLIDMRGSFSEAANGFRMLVYPYMFTFELLGLSLVIAAFVIGSRKNGGK